MHVAQYYINIAPIWLKSSPCKKLSFVILLGVMLSKTKKKKAIETAKFHDTDTGSPEVQISILTKRIEELALHLKRNQKDHHSRRGLLGMVSERQSHMNFLQKKNVRRYNALLKKLNLKKKA